MRLFITSKLSVARLLAAALATKARPAEKYPDHFAVSHGDGERDLVTWCGGHLLELAPPESYDLRYRKWRLEELPIFPQQLSPAQSSLQQWKWLEAGDPLASKRQDLVRQLQFIRHTLPTVEPVVHAGDPDREGQWLVDELLEHLQYRGRVQRLRLSSLHWRAVRDSLKKFAEAPPDNADFQSLSISAQTRSRADWLYGLNMTRAYTLLGRHAGYQEVLSVGRVQTPLLALVARRDESIEQFVASHYYELLAKFRKGDNYFHALYVHRAGERDSLEKLAALARGKTAVLLSRDCQHHRQAPPLPLDLSALQIECAERYGYSALEVMQAARRLYEEYHLISYPLSDCRYLPAAFRQQAESVLEAACDNLAACAQLANSAGELKKTIQHHNTWRESAAWDDSKLTHQHAIIPTAQRMEQHSLSETEQHVYEWIVRYYSAQFFEDTETLDEQWLFAVAEQHYRATKQSLLQRGWKEILVDGEDSLQKRDVPSPSWMAGPDWSAGESLLCEDLEIRERRTRPPARFTEASLMAAMAHIAPFVHSETVRACLHRSDGLGTESTRAQMMDVLLRRGYLLKGNKSIFASSLGRDLIRALPEEATAVDMTALWEQRLSHIAQMPPAEARRAADDFLAEVSQRVGAFICRAQQQKNIHVSSADEILGLEHKPKILCPRCGSLLRFRAGRYGDFWGCSAYPACQATVPDRVDKQGQHHPDYGALPAAGPRDVEPIHKPVNADTDMRCPKCGKPLKKRRGQHGFFMGCSAYPACSYTTRRMCSGQEKQ